MDTARIRELQALYRRTLLEDVIPFWLKHSLDYEHGGYLTCLGRDGAVYDTDKAIWLQGREIWMFSKLYNTVEPRDEWLNAARLGFDFLTKHGFDSDGRMFFSVTRDGRPLRKRRYYYSEHFAAIAFAEYARANQNAQAHERAKATYHRIVDLYRHPEQLAPKVNPQSRQAKAHAIPMILLATTLEMRQLDDDPLYDEMTDDALDQILNHFVQRDARALFETVGPNGERLDSAEGRTINPGHAIEAAWFIMHEGMRRSDNALITRAIEILDWSLELGWDREYGGLLYFVDIEGKPPVQLEWDMKLWWPHTEALYALLLAYHLTGKTHYAEWFETVHEWSFQHFADPEYGEWYGYLHRDGSVSTPLKGGMWKGCFHLPRALWLCWRLFNQLEKE